MTLRDYYPQCSGKIRITCAICDKKFWGELTTKSICPKCYDKHPNL